MHEDAGVETPRRCARHPWRASRGDGAPRFGRCGQQSRPSDQRRRMATRCRLRGWERAVGTLDLIGAAGTTRILPSVPCRSVGPTVPPSRSERPAAPPQPGRRGPTRSPSRPGPGGAGPGAGPENDRAPAVSGEGSIDRARCGQPPMRNIFVPQTGQVPWVAGLPFFIVIFCASFMSRFALHFTQYASATPGASLSSRWTSSGPSPGARPLRAIRVRRSHLVRIRRTQQIRGGANSRNGSPRRIGASSRFPRDWAG
jgi:hypothetical protein